MTATDSEYLELLQNLLPRGGAWPRDAAANLTKVLHGLAGEPARGHNRALDTIEEADPRTTFEMLEDWERVAGLPDPCISAAQTLQGRRDALVARLTSRGGQSAAYYIALADAIGYPITIEEFPAFRVGCVAGDALSNEGAGWEHTWRVNGPEETVDTFKAGQSGAGETLRTWGNEELECAISAKKPAHTILQFAYPEFLFLNFLGATFPAELSVSQTTGGSYIGSDGVLYWISADEPRWRPSDNGLLVEQTGRNELKHSSEFDNGAAWSNGATTITADAAAAPDGTMTAYLLEDANAGASYVLQDMTVADDTTKRRVSWFLKAGTSEWVQLVAQYFGGTGTIPNVYVNVVTGTIYQDNSDGGDAKLVSLADGWMRVDFSANNNGLGNTTLRTMIYPCNGGTGLGSVYAWGAQVETGDLATSYIATAAAAVDRAADIVKFSDIALLPWFNSAEGTLLVTAQFASMANSFNAFAYLSDGSASESIGVLKNSVSTDLQFSVLDGGVSQYAVNAGTLAENTPFKAALSWREDDFRGAVNGVAATFDTNGTVPAVTELNIGARATDNYANGLIHDVRVYPRFFSDAERIEQTT